MLEVIEQWDSELLIFLNNLGCYPYDKLWLAISHKLTWIPLYAFLLFLLFKNFKGRQLLVVLSCIGIVFFFTDFMVSQVYRPFFHRLRPCHVPELAEQLRLVKPSCGGQYGFFSAHASNSFGLATLLYLFLKNKYGNKMNFILLWAAIVSYSRVYLGVHYPLDIITGGLYGSGMAALVFQVFKKVNILKGISKN